MILDFLLGRKSKVRADANREAVATVEENSKTIAALGETIGEAHRQEKESRGALVASVRAARQGMRRAGIAFEETTRQVADRLQQGD